MDTYSLFALGALAWSFLLLFVFSQLLKSLIRKQIDEQMNEIIPIKGIRKRIGIRIKWRE